MDAFGDDADYYDILYQDKNYRAECDFLESIFDKYSNKPIKTILDLGCGTGKYAFILAEKGHKITDVDVSSKMLEIGKKKAKEKGLSVKFYWVM